MDFQTLNILWPAESCKDYAEGLRRVFGAGLCFLSFAELDKPKDKQLPFEEFVFGKLSDRTWLEPDGILSRAP